MDFCVFDKPGWRVVWEEMVRMTQSRGKGRKKSVEIDFVCFLGVYLLGVTILLRPRDDAPEERIFLISR